MRNWMLPLAVLVISGLGLAIVSERGRQTMLTLFDAVAESVTESKDSFVDFGQGMDLQLAHIQRTLDHLSQALEGR